MNDEFFVKLLITDDDKNLFQTQKFPSLNKDIQPKLTLRICLKFHMKIFDPLGLVMPTKMIGNLLFRITLQIIKKG